jgi:hypothetical protein
MDKIIWCTDAGCEELHCCGVLKNLSLLVDLPFVARVSLLLKSTYPEHWPGSSVALARWAISALQVL